MRQIKLNILPYLIFILFSVSCNDNTSPLSAMPIDLEMLNGQIENWKFSDTLNILGMSPIVDYGYPVAEETLFIYGTSNIQMNGRFSIKLKSPNKRLREDPIDYTRMWDQSDIYTQFSISDTNVLFESMRLSIYTNSPRKTIDWVINGSSNNYSFSQIFNSVGDYTCWFIYADRNVDVIYRQKYVNGVPDTIETIANLKIAKGWNKQIKMLTMKSQNYYKLIAYIDNNFTGKYYLGH